MRYVGDSDADPVSAPVQGREDGRSDPVLSCDALTISASLREVTDLIIEGAHCVRAAHPVMREA